MTAYTVEAIFCITTADGRVFTGPVHGKGGIIKIDDAQVRMQRWIARASRGAFGDLIGYEPAPGCCRMYPMDRDALDFEALKASWHTVPLAGATFEIVAPVCAADKLAA
ncbi:MAG TPA: hypothetical protein VEZ26_06125 [Sphingomonadaceae bacterium]|nr:hypothetical protein [Sphingomonadaceae bacterium]